MSQNKTLTGMLIGDEAVLSVRDMTSACGVEIQWIVELVNEGVLAPQGNSETAWRFVAADLIRVRKLARLARDFETSVSAAAVMLDLIEEVARLRTRLRRAGLSTD